MKSRIAFLIYATFVLMLSCSDDKPSEPDQPNDTLLTSATIGADGGTLSYDGFVLSVPGGAFNSSAVITLYESQDEPGFGSNAVSPLYRLDGIPDVYGDSLYVRLRYNGTLAGESYIAYGRETELIESDNLHTVYSLLSSQDSSGFLLAALPPRDDSDPGTTGLAAGAASSGNNHFMAAVTNQEINFISPLFTIHYPLEDIIWSANELKSYLETPYTLIRGMGLEYELLSWRWPGQLVFKDMWDDQKYHWYANDVDLEIDPLGRQAPVLNVNEDLLNNDGLPKLRRILGEVMMSIAQFDSDSAGWRHRDNKNHSWHVAVRQWFQEKVTAPGTFTRPSDFTQCETFPFNGLQPGKNGCGMSPFVKYLAETEGDEVIGRIYEHIRDGKNFVDAIEASSSAPIYNWLPDFFDRYLRGTYYGISTSSLLTNPAGTFAVGSDTDTLASFYRGCPYLGAQIYRLDLEYDSISADAVLNLTIEGSGINQDYVTLLVYKYKNGAIEYVGAGNDLKVPGLRELTHAGYDILAVAVNSYSEDPHTGTTAFTLTAAVSAPRVFNFNHAKILITDITYDCYEEWEDTTSTFENHHGASWEVNGAFNENTFSGFDTWTSGDYVCSLFVSITVDPITLDITDFSAAERCGRPTYKQSRTIQAVPGVPLPSSGGGQYLYWYIHGSASVCDYFDYEGIIQGFPPQYDHWYSICNSSTCLDGDPQISIEIYKQ